MGVTSTKILGHFSNILVVLFLENRPFLRRFLPKPNNLLSPLIFFGKLKSGVSVVILGPKLRVLSTKRATFQKCARGSNTHPYLKNGIFWGWSNGKVVALGVLVICPHWNLRFQNKKLTFCPKLSRFWVPGGPAGQCCLIGSLIWKYQKFCSQYWIDYSGLTINYSIMEFTDCRKIELSWVDWLMCDSIKWLVLTFSGFVQLSKTWWGTKTCWLNDWSDWLRRRGGALGWRGCGGAGYWLQVIQHFGVWWNSRFHNLLRFQPGGQLLVSVMGGFRLFIWNFWFSRSRHLRPCQRSRSVSVPRCCNRCQAYH